MASDQSGLQREVEQICRSRIKPLLERSESDPRPVALMTCGCAGSGKSTYAKTIAKIMPSFYRLSIDDILGSMYGIYGVDYERFNYEKYQDEAGKVFEQKMLELLTQSVPSNIILERSFYAKEDRDAMKSFVENYGARVVLVYFTAPKTELWRRIVARRQAEVNADTAFEITPAILDMYHDNFEVPVGEGEIVIETSRP